jgi:thiamine-phosphate pyrophosphorylase
MVEASSGSRVALARRLTLMAITASADVDAILSAVKAVLRGGASAVQLRWKEAETRRLVELAREIRTLTAAANALLIVNDRVDVALAAGADGAHLGDNDLPLTAARRIVPTQFLLGRSVDTPEQAVVAERAGADYVGLGPIFATQTKRDTGAVVGLTGVTAVRARVTIPIVAVGGISAESAASVIRAGADGIAVVSALMSTSDPERAAAELVAAIREGGQRRLGNVERQ